MVETTAMWVGPANNQANSHIHQGRNPAAEREHSIHSQLLGLEVVQDLSDHDLRGVPLSRIVETFQRIPIGHSGDDFGP
eukprot:11995857-Ditylum_brightwellii.AAC.1